MMRNIFIIGMLLVGASMAGWFQINREGGETTIKINRTEIRSDARKAMDRGREFLDKRDQQYVEQRQMEQPGQPQYWPQEQVATQPQQYPNEGVQYPGSTYQNQPQQPYSNQQYPQQPYVNPQDPNPAQQPPVYQGQPDATYYPPRYDVPVSPQSYPQR